MCRGCCRALSAAAARLRAAGVRGGAPRGGGWAREERRPQDTPPARSAEGARVKTSQQFPLLRPGGLEFVKLRKR